jgi:hypothetical protein
VVEVSVPDVPGAPADGREDPDPEAS